MQDIMKFAQTEATHIVQRRKQSRMIPTPRPENKTPPLSMRTRKRNPNLKTRDRKVNTRGDQAHEEKHELAEYPVCHFLQYVTMA